MKHNEERGKREREKRTRIKKKGIIKKMTKTSRRKNIKKTRRK